MTQHAKIANMNNEWHTPHQYIDSARKVMGSIDTDPASNDIAQEYIQADTYYTIDNSSLDKEWSGNVWMNPPYGRTIKDFCNKLVDEFESGRVKQAIVLTNNGTDTQWFDALSGISSAICHHKKRIAFLRPTGERVNNNTKGQIFMYIGDNSQAFRDEFNQYGATYRKA
ncbi:modification methylase Bsp6I [Vibrio ishigakensis]|uniref:Modification methylase Bsp6I n=1 Tax=Vibrio ishigakensis TaxID=1481914 RepID=A0A0B8QBP9_9VIBR|nr:modification methylase Bsp6I [Vibrio ishigakensis]